LSLCLPLRMSSDDFVNAARTEEINRVLSLYGSMFDDMDVLELGSGAGAQLLAIRERCRSASGIDVSIRNDALTPVLHYDGKSIPFPDASFDLIFSSHVVEHIQSEPQVHAEMHRVLRAGGRCIHVVPSASWRFWASVLHYPALAHKAVMKFSRKAAPASSTPTFHGGPPTTSLSRWRSRLAYGLIQQRHGEHGNWVTEHFLFREKIWKKDSNRTAGRWNPLHRSGAS